MFNIWQWIQGYWRCKTIAKRDHVRHRLPIVVCLECAQTCEILHSCGTWLYILYLIYVIFVELKESILCNSNPFEFFPYYLPFRIYFEYKFRDVFLEKNRLEYFNSCRKAYRYNEDQLVLFFSRKLKWRTIQQRRFANNRTIINSVACLQSSAKKTKNSVL